MLLLALRLGGCRLRQGRRYTILLVAHHSIKILAGSKSGFVIVVASQASYLGAGACSDQGICGDVVLRSVVG